VNQAPVSRRHFLHLGAGAVLACASRARAITSGPEPLTTAITPSTGQQMPRIGLGTWQIFDVGNDSARRAQLTEVLRVFVAGGGRFIDTSPMYGSSEAVIGDLLHANVMHDDVFLATKVWTRGREAGERQMEESLRLLRTSRVELMQVHNLVDWRTHLATLRRWKEEGRIAYVGITHYAAGALDDLAHIVRRERIDFVQYALSLDEPEAGGDFLRLCADRGVAFIANRPFGGGDAFARTRGTTLPSWASELGIASWAQFLLKWVLAHPEVTCAIPGTSRPHHMRDNLAAGRDPLPDAAQRTRMAAAWRAL